MTQLRVALLTLVTTHTALVAVVLLAAVIVAAFSGWLDPITEWMADTFGADNTG